MDTGFGKIQATADADEDALSRTCPRADDTEGPRRRTRRGRSR